MGSETALPLCYRLGQSPSFLPGRYQLYKSISADESRRTKCEEREALLGMPTLACRKVVFLSLADESLTRIETSSLVPSGARKTS